jgi:hypothetical protein
MLLVHSDMQRPIHQLEFEIATKPFLELLVIDDEVEDEEKVKPNEK